MNIVYLKPGERFVQLDAGETQVALEAGERFVRLVIPPDETVEVLFLGEAVEFLGEAVGV